MALQQHTTVFLSSSDSTFDTIAKRVQESFPKSCICWIEEVKNEALQSAFNGYKEELGAFEEKQLFHGTRETIVNVIAKNGFDPEKNVRSAYGKGVYFAQNAQYSWSYSLPASGKVISYMFLCNVLLGQRGVDYGTDKKVPPSIFVTKRRESAFPRYIIAFHKYAK